MSGERPRKIVRNLIGAAIIACVAYFFLRALRDNWDRLRALEFEAHYAALALTALSIAGSNLLGTAAWQAAMNTFAKRPLSFSESIATVNISSLTKYVPGKVWAYALQMHRLSDAGVTKSMVLFANLASLAISLATSTLVGLLCLGISSAQGELRPLLLTAFLGLGAIYSLATVFHAHPLRWLAQLLGRAFKRKFEYFSFDAAALLRLNAAHASAAVLSGFSTYLACQGIGYAVTWDQAMTIMASGLIGDVVGFLAIVVPGGFGVREGVMWWLLRGATPGPVALILPIVSRLLSMGVELMLGVIALALLKRLNRERISVPVGAPGSNDELGS
ncbi:MAG TPA: hypothetical protein VFQ61_30680 [Polyangiaceae bacterium]|nr:hypothetical protein [Polyangiaceae bacterium]